MATLKWAIFCDRVEFANGKASLIGLFDAVQVPRIPTVIDHLHLVIAIRVRPMEKVPVRAVVRDPGGQVIAEVSEFGSDLGLVSDVHKGVLTFEGLPVSNPGNYIFEIFVNEKQIHREPLLVFLMR
jgi:hypothetical protein